MCLRILLGISEPFAIDDYIGVLLAVTYLQIMLIGVQRSISALKLYQKIIHLK